LCKGNGEPGIKLVITEKLTTIWIAMKNEKLKNNARTMRQFSKDSNNQLAIYKHMIDSLFQSNFNLSPRVKLNNSTRIKAIELNRTEQFSNHYAKGILLLMLFFSLVGGVWGQNLLYSSGFETTGETYSSLSTSSTTGAFTSQTASFKSGLRSGLLSCSGNGNNCVYNGSWITPNSFTFEPGYTYTVSVWARVASHSGTLRIFKNSTNTNQAMVNSTGGDIILSGTTINTTNWTQQITQTFSVSSSETKYIGIQCSGGGGNGATIAIDDLRITRQCSSVPTSQATNLTYSSVGCTSMIVNWTNGNGSKRIVKMNTSNSFINPVNGIDPIASSIYSSGEQVVFNGSGNNVTITNLVQGTTYFFRVYEANCSGVDVSFNAASGTNNPNSQSTHTTPGCATNILPSNAASNLSTSGVILSWLSGSGNPSGYDVFFGTSVTPQLVSLNQVGTSYSTGSLTASTTYYWKVVPKNCGGDATGCSTFSFTTQTACTPPTFTTSQTNVNCFGASTGNITVTASGGTSPYEYSKDNGLNWQVSNQFNSLTGGVYSIKVRNQGNQCLSSATSITITQPANAISVNAGLDITTCSGASNVIGGAPTASGGSSLYSYTWVSTPSGFNSTIANPTVTSASSTTYTVFVTDSNGCTDSDNVVVTIGTGTTKTWIGAGVQGGTGTNFNDGTKWSPSGVPSACDDIIFNLSSDATITITNNIIVKSFTSTISGNSNTRLNLGNNITFTVLGNTSITNNSSNNGNFFELNVHNGSNYNFRGDFTVSTATRTTYLFEGYTTTYANTTGTYTFGGNVTIGDRTVTYPTALCGGVIFNGISPQSVILNNNDALNLSTTTGSLIVNSGSTVTFSGSGSVSAGGNLSINGLLDLGTRTFNRSVSGGILSLGAGSTLKLSGTSGGQTGSNFPLNFATMSLDPTSTVEYFGGNQTVFATPTYGNLTISTSGTKTPGAGLTVAGNLLVNSPATFVGSTFTHTFRGNWTNNGTFTPGTGIVSFTGNTATQTISGTGTLNFTNVTIDKSANNGIVGSVNLNDNITISGTLTFQNGNLNLNGKTLNYSGGYGITTNNGGIIGASQNSRLNFTSSGQITSGLFQSDIYDLLIGTNATVSSAGSYTILNSLIVANGATFFKEDGSFITFKGNLVNNGSVIDGTSLEGSFLFDNNTTDQTISGQPVTFVNLNVAKTSAKLILTAPITIRGNLALSSTIENDNSLITLGSSANPGTLVHTGGRITGALRRYFANATGTNYYFPIGNSTRTRGVTINMSQAPGEDQYITAQYMPGTPQVNNTSLYSGLPLTTADGQLIQNYDEEGYWQIDPKQYDSGIDAANYTISLQMNNVSGVNDFSKTRVIKADGPSHISWSALSHVSTSGDNTNYTLTASGNGFSWFNAGGDNNNNPLPVELVSFSGTCEEGVVNLTWQTASEFNSSHFDVEKSRDGENWQVINTVASAGTSNELITYQSADKNGTDGNNYYRLRQMDIDGTEKVYDPINVSCVEVTTGYFSTFPNPSGTSFQVTVNNKELIGICMLKMVDATGKVIEQREIEMNDGINMFVISQELTPGIYFLNISNGTKSTPVLRHAVK
jgi:hypothetical protein